VIIPAFCKDGSVISSGLTIEDSKNVSLSNNTINGCQALEGKFNISGNNLEVIQMPEHFKSPLLSWAESNGITVTFL